MFFIVENVMEKKVTIREVAREAGVAISTASNALNGSDLVRDETKRRVVEAAKRLGYVPNMSGRVLKSGKSRQLCFLTSTVTGEYFSRLIDAMNHDCVEHGYGLNVVISRDKNHVMQVLLGGSFDGCFLFEGERIGDEDLDVLHRERVPLVLLDRKREDTRIGCVLFNSYKASFSITSHLIGLGHRRFCFVEGNQDNFDAVERKRGFLDALKQGRIDPASAVCIQGYFDENIAFSAVLALAADPNYMSASRPTAYVCGNDRSAIGAIKALKQLGYSVPGQVSVVGFDDMELSQYFQPALTTVRTPIEQQAQTAVAMMVDILEGKSSGRTELLDGSIVARDSTWICES